MASVFLSYDRDDADKARPIAIALEKADHSVWWDLHVRGGAQFSKVIEEALKAADAVVVLWSKNSVESAWVRDEAAAGRDSGRLVPVSLDETEPPLGFRQYQTVDMSSWKGRGKSAQLRVLLADIDALASRSRAEPGPKTVPIAEPVQTRRFVKSSVAAVALAAVLVFGIIGWLIFRQPSSIPVIAVASADSSPASEALARDLLVKLGSLQTARPSSMDLASYGSSGAKKAALIFQVGAGSGNQAQANLALINPRGSTMLWAKDFQQPQDKAADLKQQVAYTAALVLGCALEGSAPGAGRLSRQALKAYLNACSQLSDSTGDTSAEIAALRQVVRDAPRFAGGWAMLLRAEVYRATHPDLPEYPGLRSVLAKHIAEAREVNPDLAEAYLAEFALTPDAEFVERSRLLDRAVERNPQHAEVRATRSAFLMTVGRLEEALQDGKRAVELDPLSPAIRDGYISSLAFGGRLDAALAELREAERLWPGTTSMVQARYRVHLRAGDPREALRLLRSGAVESRGSSIQESFVLARIDRSPANVERAISEAASAYREFPEAIVGLAQTLAEFGRNEELFRVLLNWRRMDLVSYVTDVVFRPPFQDLHADPQFIRVADRLGLLDYWRTTSKWPDFCSRPDLPYDCKAEAAKIAAIAA